MIRPPGRIVGGDIILEGDNLATYSDEAMRAVRVDIDGPSYRQHIAHERARTQGGAVLDDDAPSGA